MERYCLCGSDEEDRNMPEADTGVKENEDGERIGKEVAELVNEALFGQWLDDVPSDTAWQGAK
jgi:hypothetical protein